MAVAVALSPLTPIGVARLAEVTPGPAADWPVLAIGGLAIVAFVGGCGHGRPGGPPAPSATPWA